MSSPGRDFWDGAISMTPAAHQFHSVPDITSPFSACPLELSVFVPCHNDEESIADTLTALIEAMEVVGKSYEIIIIDDCSKDHTVERVREFMAGHKDVNILMRSNKQRKGLAQNYTDGAFMGRGTYYTLVYGDNALPVETMVDIFGAVGDADIVVPYYISRLRQGRLRWFAARLGTGFLNVISGNRINCYTAQQVHLRYNVMRWHTDVLGYAFQMDLLCQLLAHDFTCKQVPCRAASLHRSDSGLGIKQTLSVVHAVVNIVLRRVSRAVNG